MKRAAAPAWEKRFVGEIDVVSDGASYVQSVHVLVDSGAHGRLLQYIKTALRDPSYDGTQIFDRFHTVDELIADILRPLKVSADRNRIKLIAAIDAALPRWYTGWSSRFNLHGRRFYSLLIFCKQFATDGCQ